MRRAHRLTIRQTAQSRPLLRRLATVTAISVITSLIAPVSLAVAASGPDYSRKWSPPNTPLPTTKSVDGHDVPAIAAAKPAHPVPPTWQPPKTPRPLPRGRAEVRLGASPAAAKQARPAGERPPAGPDTAAAGLPVSLAPVEGSALGGQNIQVEMVDPTTAGATGIPGPVLTLRHGDV